MSPFLPIAGFVKRPFDTVTTRSAIRAFGIGVLFVILLCAVVEGSEHALAPATTTEKTAADRLPVDHPDHGEGGGAPARVVQELKNAGTRQEIAAETHPASVREQPAGEGGTRGHSEDLSGGGTADPLTRIAFFRETGRRAWLAGDTQNAETAFAMALEANAPAEAKRDLLLEMGELYAQGGAALKAIATFEKFLQLVPGDRSEPSVLLKLGILYRESGALTLAISRFFLVLNSTLQVAPEDFGAYRRLAMKARLEVAETYSLQGSEEEARKYYSRLELLDLDDADRERVVFRGAQLQYSLGEWLAAERQLADFISKYPQSGNVPEARYLRAKALEQLKRRDQSVQEVLALLQQEASAAGAAGNLAYWKRRTGNELANRFYEQGDVLGALSIYQALARANEDPSWQWPAVYQIGLCFERLNLPERARQAYRVIVPEKGQGTLSSSAGSAPAALAAVHSMAKWRLEHLDWIEGFDRGVQALTLDNPLES